MRHARPATERGPGRSRSRRPDAGGHRPQVAVDGGAGSAGRLGRGPVADAAHGHDVARLVGVVAELVAEPADVDVDRPVEDLLLARAVDRVEQLVAGQRAPVRRDERHEQPELHRRQRDELGSATDLVALRVDDRSCWRRTFPAGPVAWASPARPPGRSGAGWP